MDQQSPQSGSTGPASTSQQGGAQAPSSAGTPSGQQEQFGAAAGQQGGTASGGSGGTGTSQGGADDASRRSGNPYADFLSRRGTNPLELLKRLDEDVDRLFHQFVGGGRELLNSRLRNWGGPGAGGQTVDAPAAAGSSGGSDGSVTEAPGSAGGSGMAMAPGSGWLPEVEVSERNGKLVVHADLPGLSREQVQIGFEDGQLVLQGERRSTQTSVQPGGYYRTERTYGHFRRVVPLPEGVNPDTAQAGFHNGVLEVCFDMPARHARTRQIPINEGHPTSAAGSTGTAGGAGAAGSEVGS